MKPDPAWLAHLTAKDFPVAEWRDPATPWERWCELALWHEALRREWARTVAKGLG